VVYSAPFRLTGNRELKTMARAAKATKTTKPVATGRKPGRPASTVAKTPAKVTKPTAVPKRTATVAPATAGRKPGRPAAATAAKAPAKVTKAAAAPKRAPVAAAAVPKLSKDELRVQVEKLEHANAMLRAKSREANRTAKAAAARIAELEDQLARLEATTALQTAPGKRAPKPTLSARRTRRSRDIDPGDAVPPGVAVQEPAPLDKEAETALENLEEHLRGE
jgi:hypothetical protein